MNSRRFSGFALPTVLITSIVMIMVLLVAVTSTAAISTSLTSQYYNQLSRTAGEAGAAYAKACLVATNGIPLWSDAQPLTPGTDCAGTQLVGFTCPAGSMDARCSVMVNSNVRSTFSVGKPDLDSSGKSVDIHSNGSVGILRTSDSSVWRTYSQSSFVQTVSSPIITNGLVLNLDANNKKSLTSNVQPYATDLYAWTPIAANANLSRDTIASPVGNTPLKMVVTANDPYTNSYNMPSYNLYPTTVGKTWTVSVWAKIDAVSAVGGQLFIFGANSSGGVTEVGATGIALTTSWQRFSYTYTTTNASTTYIQARLDGTDSGGVGRTIWWDGMQLEQGNSMTEFSKYSLGMNVHPASSDLFSWISTASNANLSRDTIASPVGNTPLKMSVTGNDPYTFSYNSATYNLAPTTIGKTWTVSVWAKADAANTNSQLSVFFANSTGGYLGGGMSNVTLSTSWQKFSLTVTASDIATAFVQSRLDGPDGAGKTVWWDGMQVQEGANIASSWNDLTVNNNMGALNNGATYSNGGVAFNGVNSYANVGNGTSLNVGNNLSIGAWIRPTLLFGRFGVYSTRNTNQAGSFQLEVGTGSSGVNRVGVTGVGTWRAETPDNALSLNTWQYVVYTTDGTNQSIYINGISQPLTTAPYTFVDNTDLKLIGQGTLTSQFFSGSIGAVQVYNRALSAAEVEQNFNALKNNYIQQVQVLVVAGGGGGSSGGGGAGGVVSSSVPAVAGSYSVTVGAGGIGCVGTGGACTNGQSSAFGSLIAIGGGYGGRNDTTGSANFGGSGGGGGSTSTVQDNGGAGTPGQGYVGGAVVSTYFPSPYPSAGGGGAGAAGSGPTGASTSGNGGNGLIYSITGSPLYYAGGGGGATWGGGTNGTGGLGGGGNGGATGAAGAANSGGGGGGAATNGTGLGGTGGSGVVIISYPTGSISATGGTIVRSGSNTVHTFTSSGTFTILYANFHS